MYDIARLANAPTNGINFITLSRVVPIFNPNLVNRGNSFTANFTPFTASPAAFSPPIFASSKS